MNPKSQIEKELKANRKRNQRKIMRSNLPLWLALAFHELAPIVAILDLLRSQPYQ